MRNPFSKKKKKLPSIVKNVITGNNTISGSVSGIPSNLTPIMITGVSGSYGVQGPIGVQGVTGFSYASAATYTWMDPEEIMKRRKAELMKEFEQNPELFSEIIVELRQRKIRQLKEKSTNH